MRLGAVACYGAGLRAMSARPILRPGKRQSWLRKKTIVRGSLDRTPLVPRSPLLNVYLHEIYGRDERVYGLHDHPWPSLAIVLEGKLRELVHVDPERESHRRDVLRQLDRGFPTGVHAFYARPRYHSSSETYPETRLIDVPRIKFRGPRYAHALVPATDVVRTLFITGPAVQRWGFYTPFGWVHWRAKETAFAVWADLGHEWAASSARTLGCHPSLRKGPNDV